MRVLVADDHEVVRSGIRAVLAQTDIEIVGEALDGDEAVEMTLEKRPDLLILDVRMPKCDGLKALGKIKLERPDQPVLMFSSHDNPTYVARAVALGANGYLLKECTAAEFLDAVNRTGRGETIWTREELRRVTGALATPRMSTDIEVPLTQRESEVLKHLSLGLTNKEIAHALDISYETVKEHVQHILRKVGVADRTQAAVWAVRKGLL
ncbi:MAG: response regulator transcription factor [Pirellulales bacterium]